MKRHFIPGMDVHCLSRRFTVLVKVQSSEAGRDVGNPVAAIEWKYDHIFLPNRSSATSERNSTIIGRHHHALPTEHIYDFQWSQ